MKDIAIDIRKRRIAAGLTQLKLSQLAGISESCINNVENEANRPRLATMEKIEAALRKAEFAALPAHPLPKEESPERGAIIDALRAEETKLRTAAAANGQHPRAGAVMLPATLVAYGVENNLSLRQALAMARMVRALAGHVAEDPRASHWRKIHEAIEDLMP